MARIKIAYIGGGSTRAPGTLASFVERGERFNGSEIVLIDLDAERLRIVQTLGQKLARARGVDLTISATTDRRAGLQDCAAVLSSYRPGGFQARALDERLPLKHGVIGQETQGPGGFFMALRAIHVLHGLLADMQAVCPQAWLFNYTNPVNIVAQAVARYTPVPVVSLCEGPLIFPRLLARFAGLDPAKVEAVMVGLNHACWSVTHTYGGQDLLPLIVEAYESLRTGLARSTTPDDRLALRLLRLAATMGSLPASYFQYYYFHDEVLAEQQASATTRAEDILARVPDYWRHYAEQAAAREPRLDPRRSRGGLHELELAVDVMDAVFNDTGAVWPVNVPNQGALPDFPAELVVEVPAHVSRAGFAPLPQPPLPRAVVGLVKMLGEYQWLAAEAAWCGTRADAVRALASHPLCFSLSTAQDLYDELAAAHKEYLPERLLY